jgi:predicted mannosyl-3-phosphoglycerate phosphatase (HAD superfamily)
MPKLRRTQTIYVTLDAFLSPRGKVLHHFDQFLQGVGDADFPCIWLTGLTRAQLDEPRRRLGHSEPFIGENGCGVYLPEDYFHLKAANSIRLGRFTCMPLAKPQPAASRALEELSEETSVPVVSLRSLSLRELSQNTGLPTSEAEHIRMRDFDELFFFAGASQQDISSFLQEAQARSLTVQRCGAFWSLSCEANPVRGIRELGTLYDRSLRSHVPRVGIAVSGSPDAGEAAQDPAIKALFTACDRVILLSERQPAAQDVETGSGGPDEDAAKAAPATGIQRPPGPRAYATFHLHSATVWDEVLEAILARA